MVWAWRVRRRCGKLSLDCRGVVWKACNADSTFANQYWRSEVDPAPNFLKSISRSCRCWGKSKLALTRSRSPTFSIISSCSNSDFPSSSRRCVRAFQNNHCLCVITRRWSTKSVAHGLMCCQEPCNFMEAYFAMVLCLYQYVLRVGYPNPGCLFPSPQMCVRRSNFYHWAFSMLGQKGFQTVNHVNVTPCILHPVQQGVYRSLEHFLSTRIGASGQMWCRFIVMTTTRAFVDAVCLEARQLSICTIESRHLFGYPQTEHLGVSLHCFPDISPCYFAKPVCVNYLPSLEKCDGGLVAPIYI